MTKTTDKKVTVFVCSVCEKEITQEHENFTTGYGVDDKGNKVCYSCCADNDKQYMRDNGKIALYLSKNDNGTYKITNWPGSLEILPTQVTKGHHNMAGSRYDAWFRFEGKYWHGVQYGENSQIIHCKVTKGK